MFSTSARKPVELSAWHRKTTLVLSSQDAAMSSASSAPPRVVTYLSSSPPRAANCHAYLQLTKTSSDSTTLSPGPRPRPWTNIFIRDEEFRPKAIPSGLQLNILASARFDASII